MCLGAAGAKTLWNEPWTCHSQLPHRHRGIFIHLTAPGQHCHKQLPCTSAGVPTQSTAQGTGTPQPGLWSLLPAPQGNTEHFSAHQEIQFCLPTLFNLDNSIQSQSQQQGLDYRSAKWLMLNINKPENANSFRSRIVVMGTGDLKSGATSGISVREVLSAACGKWSDCLLHPGSHLTGSKWPCCPKFKPTNPGGLQDEFKLSKLNLNSNTNEGRHGIDLNSRHLLQKLLFLPLFCVLSFVCTNRWQWQLVQWSCM